MKGLCFHVSGLSGLMIAHFVDLTFRKISAGHFFNMY